MDDPGDAQSDIRKGIEKDILMQKSDFFACLKWFCKFA